MLRHYKDYGGVKMTSGVDLSLTFLIFILCGWVVIWYANYRWVIWSRKDIERRLELEIEEKERIGRDVPPGSGAWSYSKGWIDAIRWFLGEE